MSYDINRIWCEHCEQFVAKRTKRRHKSEFYDEFTKHWTKSKRLKFEQQSFPDISSDEEEAASSSKSQDVNSLSNNSIHQEQVKDEELSDLSDDDDGDDDDDDDDDLSTTDSDSETEIDSDSSEKSSDVDQEKLVKSLIKKKDQLPRKNRELKRR